MVWRGVVEIKGEFSRCAEPTMVGLGRSAEHATGDPSVCSGVHSPARQDGLGRAEGPGGHRGQRGRGQVTMSQGPPRKPQYSGARAPGPQGLGATLGPTGAGRGGWRGAGCCWWLLGGSRGEPLSQNLSSAARERQKSERRWAGKVFMG